MGKYYETEDINLIPACQKIVYDWNNTRKEIPAETIHELFEIQVNNNPEKTALYFRDEKFSYALLNEKINRLANYIVMKGVKEGELVGIFLSRSPGMVIALLAVLKCGAAYVPIDPLLPEERVSYMIMDSDIKLIITEKNHSNFSEQIDKILIDSERDNIDGESSIFAKRNLHQLLRAYVIYTSGSTGHPKGVQITHRNVVNFLNSMKDKPGLNSNDILLAVTTLSFDIAVLEILLPLVTGASVVIASQEEILDGRILSLMIKKYNVTIMQATPATWRLMLDTGWSRDPSVKILCGGESLNENIKSELLKNGGTLWNMYGPTETTVWSSIKEISKGTPISIGHPIHNTRFYILDEKMNLLPPDIPGELYIAGEGVSIGYLNRPELNSEKFIPDPFQKGDRIYRTGDKVKYTEDRDIIYIDRIDNQVKIRGYRIEPGEIEAKLKEIHYIKDAVVVASEDKTGVKLLIAYLISNEDDLNISGIRNILKLKIPDYMIPSDFIQVKEFPRNSNGKIDRKKLSLGVISHHKMPVSAPIALDILEMQIIKIWEKVLDRNNISRFDNFFEIGGHSLAAARMFTIIESTFGMRLPTAPFIDIETVSGLAEYIKTKTGVL